MPQNALLLETESLENTFENARLSKPIGDAHLFKSGLLVTSAFHMPRALAVFRRVGFNVEPSQRILAVDHCSKAVFSLSCRMLRRFGPRRSW